MFGRNFFNFSKDKNTSQNPSVFTLKIGGQAGQGIKSSGLAFAKFAVRSGYHIHSYSEYPSLIRGGHNMMQVSVSPEEVSAPVKKTDFLIALNQDTVNRYAADLSGSAVLFDKGSDFDLSELAGADLFPVPLKELAGGDELLSNTVALGAVAALLGGDLLVIKKLLKEEFSRKGEEVVSLNLKAAQAGFDFAAAQFAGQVRKTLQPRTGQALRMVVNGNEAMSLGAVSAGIQFAAIYPMTPITGLLQNLAGFAKDFGFIYKQPEDEIAAVNMAVGASFAGARSMTATSGGGFCLMTEGLGLAAMTETPLVIVEGMRPGPATGLPTWTEQGDLQFVLHAHQGDFPRIVLAPGDAKEAYDLTRRAFDLADKYQTPVVVLVDKNICEDDQSVPLFEATPALREKPVSPSPEYQRFALQADGVSPRVLPGNGTFFITNSDEHNPAGFSSEDAGDRRAQMEKRMAKLENCGRDEMPVPEVFGPKDAEVTVVSWGSNKGAILEALKKVTGVNFLYLTWMSPFPADAVKELLNKSRHVIDIECNYSGQLASLIKEKTGLEISDKLLKYDGRPFFVEEIVEKLNSVYLKSQNSNVKSASQTSNLESF